MNKKNNKGFSLVELIVVIAVMAVLVGVLAPAYLRYVDKAKVQKDVSAVAEVVEAVKMAASESDVSKELAGTKVTLNISNTGAISGGTTNLLKEVKATVGDTLGFSSSSMTAITIDIKQDATNYNLLIDVEGGAAGSDLEADLDALDEPSKDPSM